MAYVPLLYLGFGDTAKSRNVRTCCLKVGKRNGHAIIVVVIVNTEVLRGAKVFVKLYRELVRSFILVWGIGDCTCSNGLDIVLVECNRRRIEALGGNLVIRENSRIGSSGLNGCAAAGRYGR